ncbi:mitochondrial assembly of ribosomal large subunit protein 1 [Scleropages formosus]|uniref:Mitochondrial assembly of ribosomal large subunit protein 1 n=1 Tax=Scleropages formosus TaxID=113540 RepID=A0A8C9VD02_SCLFO|nr:mitochondrial assembly of ribosomal large subunit protein 1 [Scleropages formosus]
MNSYSIRCMLSSCRRSLPQVLYWNVVRANTTTRSLSLCGSLKKEEEDSPSTAACFLSRRGALFSRGRDRYSWKMRFYPDHHHHHHRSSASSFSKTFTTHSAGVMTEAQTQQRHDGSAADLETDDEDVRKRPPCTFNIDVVVALLRQENAADVCVINVPKEMKYVDYFVVVSGSSTRHLIAMAEYSLKVYKSMKTDADPHVRIEGRNSEDWLCIDFGHIVVHFMLPETRELYELEKLWTLRSFDEQLSLMPTEILPEDFIYEDKSKDWRSGFGEGGGVKQL